MSRTTRERSFRDPVHDFITLNDRLLLELIDTPEFQRLRRIRQLGGSYGTYHGAEHSRFGHSMGVMWIMHRILERMEAIGVPLDDEVRTVAQCAALLHDIGHGPFSHALEGHLSPGRRHETWSTEVVLGDTAVHRTLRAYDERLPEKVAAAIAGTWDGPRFVQSLVSSQLDVDRMDYLIRDSVYTGVTYGHYDLNRLINMLTVVDGQVVLQTKGIVAAEEYILARYYMYWQVYLHKTTRGQEHVLRNIWRRARDLHEAGEEVDAPKSLRPWLRGEGGLADYLEVDDHDIMCAVKAWRTHPDSVLSDLSRRFLYRDLLKPLFKVPHEWLDLSRLDEVREIVEAAGWDARYYVIVDRTSDVAYDYYTADEEGGERKSPILALNEAGVPCEIATLSHTIRAVATRRKVAANLYVPAECLPRVRACLGVGGQSSV